MKEIKGKTEQETIEYTIVEENEASISDDEPTANSSLMTMHTNSTLFGFRVSSSVSQHDLGRVNNNHSSLFTLPKFVDSLKCSHENCQESFARLVDLHNHMFYIHNKVKQE